jgi:hypothetical protein
VVQGIICGRGIHAAGLMISQVADGYHRLSLAYALDPYAEVPLKLGPASGHHRQA